MRKNRKKYKDSDNLLGLKMEINYDKNADAVYIELSKANFSTNKKIDDFTILDFDEEGKIIGIELLDASKRMPKESLSEVKVGNFLKMK